VEVYEDLLIKHIVKYSKNYKSAHGGTNIFYTCIYMYLRYITLTNYSKSHIFRYH